jgi:Glu-tRNA(Gln) amidotransferase subunit E-like FAD-binding protein
MKLYLKEQAHEVPLHDKLTPALYQKLSPILQKLVNTKGAQSALEQDIMEKVLMSEALASKVNLSKGQDAFEDLLTDPSFQEILKASYLRIRMQLFAVMNIDAETIPVIFEFAKEAINTSKITNEELLSGLMSEPSSDFWDSQDVEGLLNDLEFFRSTVCRRIRVL